MVAKRARWALLGIFPLVYVVVAAGSGSGDKSLLPLTALNAAACALLLSQLRGPARRNLWAWVPLLVFLDGYFLKIAWFSSKLDSPYFIDLYYPELRWVTTGRILSAYPLLTLGFVTFCVVASAFLLGGGAKGPRESGPALELRVNNALHLVVIVTLLYALATMVQYRLGYGFAGVANPVLPLHLGTILTFFRRNLAPGLLLLAIWAFDDSHPTRANVLAVVLLVCGVVDGLISASRGSMFYFVAPVFVLWILTKRFTLKRVAVASAALVLTVVLIPTITSLRLRSINQSSAEVLVAPTAKTLTDSSIAALGRVAAGGVDGIWYALDVKSRTFSVGRLVELLKPRALTTFYTYSVVHVRIANDFRAPGIMGAFVIIGGGTGLVVLMALLLALLRTVWSLLSRARTWPVALALGTLTIFGFVTDGTLDAMLFVKLLLVVGACELVTRAWLAHPVRAGAPVEPRVGVPARVPARVEARGRQTLTVEPLRGPVPSGQ